jgi:shikimate kinase
MKACVVLIGFMGSGKTTTGQCLSKALGFSFVDTDHWIEEKCGIPVREIFRLKGEPFFREEERKALKECLGTEKCVLATGGGLWLNDRNRQLLLEESWTVWLKVSKDQVWDRVKTNLEERPLLAEAADPRQKIQDLLTVREPLYALAPFCVDTDRKSPQAVAQMVLESLMEKRPFDLPSLPI